MVANFFGVDSEGLYLSLEKETENSCPVFTSFIKRETWKFHAAFGKQRQKNVQKSVMHARAKLLLC